MSISLRRDKYPWRKRPNDPNAYDILVIVTTNERYKKLCEEYGQDFEISDQDEMNEALVKVNEAIGHLNKVVQSKINENVAAKLTEITRALKEPMDKLGKIPSISL
jgi:hypothetical protein